MHKGVIERFRQGYVFGRVSRKAKRESMTRYRIARFPKEI